MKLGFLLGYSGKHIHIPIELIQQAESMGYDSVWTAEAYGNDAVTSAAWVLAQTRWPPPFIAYTRSPSTLGVPRGPSPQPFPKISPISVVQRSLPVLASRLIKVDFSP